MGDDRSAPREEGAPTTLSGGAAVDLASALVSNLARRNGIRALLLKGRVAEIHGLRPPRISADVDVLVEPQRFDDLVAALSSARWHERVHLWLFDRLDEHSVALINDDWPIDIDVHRHFPGFLEKPDDVFDALWRHHQEFSIASQPVDGLDRVAAAAVQGLHSLRSMHSSRSELELAFLSEQLRGDQDLIRGLLRLATETGSTETLRPLFAQVGVTPGPSSFAGSAELMEWRRRVAHPSRAGRWMTYFLNTPLRHWPREIRTVVWPTRAMFLQDHPEYRGVDGRLVGARMTRLRRGAAGVVAISWSRVRRRGH